MNCPDMPARTGISAVLARTCWRTWWSLARRAGSCGPSIRKMVICAGAGRLVSAGIFGGIECTATDGKRIYVAISNSFHVPTKLIDSQTTANGGFRNAVDAATGKILWQTADPDDAADYGSVSEANGLIYGGSLSGKMYALDAKTARFCGTSPPKAR